MTRKTTEWDFQIGFVAEISKNLWRVGRMILNLERDLEKEVYRVRRVRIMESIYTNASGVRREIINEHENTKDYLKISKLEEFLKIPIEEEDKQKIKKEAYDVPVSVWFNIKSIKNLRRVEKNV